MQLIQRVLQSIWLSIKDGTHVARNVLPILIPVIIFVRILQEFSLVQYVAIPLAPIMDLVGLPVEIGLVWATAMLVNIYSAIVILSGVLLTIAPLTVEQVTVLGLLILIAHNLIVETRIAGQCGLSMPFQFALRVVTAIVAGMIFHGICSFLNLLQEPAVLFISAKPSLGWIDWLKSEIWNLCQIYVLICFVMLFMRAMDYFKIKYWMGRGLAPLLRLLGISSAATSVVIIGLFMGVLYGSGAIIQSSRSGEISSGDVFFSMSFIGIAHALFEDTFLLVLIGGSLWGLLVFRFFMAISVGIGLNYFYTRKRKVA